MRADVGLILGASGGIGSACRDRLAGLTQTIIAVSRQRPPEMAAERDAVDWIQADLSTSPGRAKIVAAVARTGVPIRYVVFASGVPLRGAIDGASEADWIGTFSVNVFGPGVLLGNLLALRWSKPASVVFVGSLAGRRALPLRAVYGASKAALEQFARVAAVELASRRIRVNVASLGVTDTPFLEGDRAALARYVKDRVPAGRASTAEEAARLIQFLIEAPDTLTGSIVSMDGGAGARG